MKRVNWVHIVLAVLVALFVLFLIRMHGAAGQGVPPRAAAMAVQR